jgi:hypothetical protein
MSDNVGEWMRNNSDGKEDFQSKGLRVLCGGSFLGEASTLGAPSATGSTLTTGTGSTGFGLL